MPNTRETIEWLKSIKEKYIHGGDDGFDEKRRQAIDEAVSVLANYEATAIAYQNGYEQGKSDAVEEIAKKICESYEECTEGVCPGWDYCNLTKRNGILEWMKMRVNMTETSKDASG